MANDDSGSMAEAFGEWQELRDAGDLEGAERVAAEHPEIQDMVRAAEWLDHDLFSNADGATREFHDFRIRRELGRGGMGVVYEAEQISLRRVVALKVLAAGPGTSPKAVKRFEREAHAAARLHHTNIAPIYAMGMHEGRWFYAMELVRGRSLGEVIEDLREERKGGSSSTAGSSGTGGGRDWYVRVAEMFAGVADALELAHRHGIFHRDVKPSNLMLDEDGTLKLVDFGLAMDTSEAGPSMTLTGDLIGTPAYMSPEQATAKRVRVDHRTDVYSLGATLYETLALEPPFRGDSLHELCSQILTIDPVPLRKRGRTIPRDLETIVAKAMEKDRERRYATAEALARDLRAFAAGGPIRARPVGPVERAWRKVKRNPVRSALVAAVLLLAVTGGLLFARARSQANELAAAEYIRLISRGEEVMGAAFGQGVREFEAASLALLEESPAEYFGRAIDLDPDRPEAYWLRVFAPGRTAEEREADAEAAFARGGVSRRSLHLYRAFLLGGQGKAEEARREHELATSFPVQTPFDEYLDARLLATAGEVDDAIAALDRAVGDENATHTVQLLATRFRARLRWPREDYEGVIDDLNRLRDLGYDSPGILAGLAIARLRLGSPQAEGLFDEALDQVEGRGDPLAWVSFLRILPNPEECDWLLRGTARALGRFPDEPALHALRAGAIAWTGDVEGTLRESEIAARAGPDFHLQYVQYLTWAGKHQEALDSSEAMLAADPEPTFRNWYLLYRAQALNGVRRPGEALQLLGEAQVGVDSIGDPNDAADAWNRALRANIHLFTSESLWQLGRYEEAVEAAKRAVELGTATRCYAGAEYAAALVNVSRFAEAKEALLRTLDDCHDHSRPRVLQLLGVAHANLGEFREAATVLEEAVTRTPEDSLAWMWLAHVRSKLKDRNGAREAAERVEEADLDRLGMSFYPAMLAVIRQRLGDEAGAAAAAAAARKQVETEPPLAKASTLMKLAEYRADRREWAEAARVARAAIELNGTMNLPWIVLGDALRNLDDPAGAIEAYRRVLDLPVGPRDRSVAWCGIGGVQLKTDPEAALETARQGLAEVPDSGMLKCLEGEALLGLNRTAEARAAFEAAIRLGDGMLERAYSFLISLLADREGKKIQALQVVDEGLKRFPESGLLWQSRAAVLMQIDGNRRKPETWNEILESLVRAIRYGVEDVSIWSNRGSALIYLNRQPEALPCFDRALELDPSGRLPRHNRAILRIQLGDIAGGLDDRAILFAQGHLTAAEALPIVWMSVLNPDPGVRDTERALTVARRIAELEPDSPATWMAMGAALLRSGDTAGAAENLRRCMELAERTEVFAALLYAQALAAEGRLAEAAVPYERFAGFSAFPSPRDRALFEAIREETSGVLSGAVDAGRGAAEEARRRLAETPEDPGLQAALAESLHRLGSMLLDAGRFEEAGGSLREGLALRRELAARDDAGAEDRRALAEAERGVGDALCSIASYEDALAHYRKAREIEERLLADEASTVGLRPDLVLDHREIASLLGRAGDFAGAVDSCRRAIDLSTALLGEGRDDLSRAHEVVDLLKALAGLHRDRGDLDACLEAVRFRQQHIEAFLAARPASSTWKWELALSRQWTARLLQERGEADKALAELEAAARQCGLPDDYTGALGQQLRGLRLIREGKEPGSATERLDVACAVYLGRTDPARAFDLYRRALEDPMVRADLDRFGLHIGTFAAAGAIEGAPPEEASGIRATALAWLREDLERRAAAAKSKSKEDRPAAVFSFVDRLRDMRRNRGLAVLAESAEFERIFEEILDSLPRP